MHHSELILLLSGLTLLCVAAQPCAARSAHGLAGHNDYSSTYQADSGFVVQHPWDPSGLAPYQHTILPEAPTNGVKRTVFNISMWILWILFGVLGVWQLPLLHLWMVLGVATIIIGFILLGPMNKYHSG